jgi:hypothetical protein
MFSRQLDPGVDPMLVRTLNQLVNESTDLSHIAGRFSHPLFARIQFLQDNHGQEYVMFVEPEDRRWIVHQNVGIEHKNPSTWLCSHDINGSCDLWMGTGRAALG